MNKVICVLSAEQAKQLIATPAVRTDQFGQIMWDKVGCSCNLLDELHQYQSTHDLKTGLPNLELLIERMDNDLTSGRACSLVFLIVNGLNEIAEHQGIAAGIHAMRTFANRLRQTIGENGFVAHLHGDLFAAVCYEADPAIMARQLWVQAIRPIAWQGREHQLIVMAGVVCGQDNPGTAETLIQAGYAAAKHCRLHDARGGIHLFTPELKLRIERQYLMDSRLRLALTGQGLSLAMQPKVCAVEGHILGAEALIRWHDEHLGQVSPVEFIPLAEQNGTISSISSWVLREALLEAAKWQVAGLDLSIAVNLSALDLRQPDLVATIHAALIAANYPASRLVIELTESAVAEDPIQAIQQLQELKLLGVALSLDDFGTGYSSLSYLRRFPIDTLKIDRSFVIDTPEDADAVAIVNSIVALARTLGMKTVAEGVETRQQAEFLRDIGVDILQGYLFSPPVDAERFLALTKGKLLS